MAKNEVIELLKKYCILLNSVGIPIEKAFLYGSYSRNQATIDSDIDVMLVSSAFDSDDDSSNIKAWSLTRKINSRIEPYTVGLKQYLNDDNSPLLQVVKKEGIEIFYKNI